jgi:aminopeptidase
MAQQFWLNQAFLNSYADILVRYALGSGNGVKPGEVVYCAVPDVAKPMYGALQTSLLRAQAHPVMRLLATGFLKDFYNLADDKQIAFFPRKYHRARVDLADHYIGIIADHDLRELEGVEPKKIVAQMEANKAIRDWQNDKEYAGKFTWTVALWGTSAMAKAAGLTLVDYWQQIKTACFLDQTNPVLKWREVNTEQNRVLTSLNKMPIARIHVRARETDLWLTLGKKRRFVGGMGRNIPSFELFTSPDWRGTSGTVTFNQPLYRYGHIIDGVRLKFSQGKVVEARAAKNEVFLKQVLNRPNADKLGEFSLTDGRLSRITKFMANTLFDENVGGPWGNMHVAVGMSYKDAYAGDPRELNKTTAKKLGFNDSGEHTDMVSTEDRVVTAVMTNGQERVIYEKGRFTL